MHAREIVVFVCTFPLYGCILDWVSPPKDPKAEPTSKFVTDLLRIELKRVPKLKQTIEQMNVSIEESDWDRAAELLDELGETHRAIAEQLSRLGHKNVDLQARAFRDQLVRNHQSLAEASKNFGIGLRDPESEGFETGKFQFTKTHQECIDLWDSSKVVIGSLQEKYGRDFNVEP